VEGLKTRGGFEIDITWEKGKAKTLVVRSCLGGNCRLRTKAEIQSADGTVLKNAIEDNPNPLFAVNAVKKPLIAEMAPRLDIVPEMSFLYDFQTEKGKSYKFIIKQ
jgi:alpha-L-fucosidase 2